MPKFYIKSRHGDEEFLVDRLNVREALDAYELRMGQRMSEADLVQRDSVMVSQIGFGKRECGEYNVTIKP